jgi:hypothetical protein
VARILYDFPMSSMRAAFSATLILNLIIHSNNINCTSLLRVREVSGSSVGPKTCYLTEVFYVFFQSLLANAGIVP